MRAVVNRFDTRPFDDRECLVVQSVAESLGL